MKDLLISVQELLEEDHNPVTIAYLLNVPIELVYQAVEMVTEEQE